MTPKTDIRIERRRLEDLLPFGRNARTHSDEQIAQIAASIVEFGWTNPILIGADNVIIAGHARISAARLLQMEDVPVIVLDRLSPTQRRALVLADNRLAENAGWDEDLLRLELAALKDEVYNVDLIGFDDEELARLLAGQDAAEGLTDEDAVPEIRDIPISQLGDLWLLGEHRVSCGDATVPAHVERLMAGDTADLVFTDPPYNVDYEGYTESKLKIKGDRMFEADFKRFLKAAFDAYRAVVKSGASLYVCHSSSWQREFQGSLESAGFDLRCQIIWAKNTFAWGFGRYKFQHEPIFYCHLAGRSDSWYGDKSQSTLWQENKPAANRLHPTMKPVELVERALVNSSKAGDLVVDLFGGSGSTLIACEKTGRNARLMDLDPRYADVIIRRWQDYTGKEATLQETGQAYSKLQRSARFRPGARMPSSLKRRLGALERSQPTSLSTEDTTRPIVAIIREWLSALGVMQEPQESLAQTLARALGISMKQLMHEIRARTWPAGFTA